ncbi:MAG: serine/threonine-protein kinase [Planctomycetia bacterium]
MPLLAADRAELALLADVAKLPPALVARLVNWRETAPAADRKLMDQLVEHRMISRMAVATLKLAQKGYVGKEDVRVLLGDDFAGELSARLEVVHPNPVQPIASTVTLDADQAYMKTNADFGAATPVEVVLPSRTDTAPQPLNSLVQSLTKVYTLDGTTFGGTSQNGDGPESKPDVASFRTRRGGFLETGSILGRCIVEHPIGEGGFGTVYRGIHQTLRLPVAIKVIRPNSLSPGEELAMFKAEARMLAQLNHRNVVRVWDFDDAHEPPYIVLEYVDGLALHQLVASAGRLRFEHAVEIVLQVARGLKASLDIGIIHRDVKPANILMTKDGVAKITDFGLAKANAAEMAKMLSINMADLGKTMGTLQFMPLEQMNDESVDHRADIYALGVAFYQMLTGQLPFNGKNQMQILQKIAFEDPTPIRELAPSVPAAVERVVMKMMARQAAERFQSYDDLLPAVAALKKCT